MCVRFYVLNHSKYRFLFNAVYIGIMNGIRKPTFHAARYNRVKYLGSAVRSRPLQSAPMVFFALSRPEKGLHKKSKPYAENNEVRLIASLFTASIASSDFTGVFERSQDGSPTLRRTWYSHVYDS